MYWKIRKIDEIDKIDKIRSKLMHEKWPKKVLHTTMWNNVERKLFVTVWLIDKLTLDGMNA